MADKLPQPTDVLIGRLRRVAKWLDKEAGISPAMRARANTCWMCAARLEDSLELVAVLKQVLEYMPQSTSYQRERWRLAQAAIAKAEGR